METKVVFDHRSFCFTGALAELKRRTAQRETRSRGGMTMKVVNNHLDYLVVGSIPSNGWKFGNYGRKIEKAQELVAEGNTRLTLVSEGEFMRALAETASVNDGDIDGKVIVLTYTFTAPSHGSFDLAAVEALMRQLSTEHECHVRTSSVPARVRNELFGGLYREPVPDDHFIFDLRIVRHMHVDQSHVELTRFVKDGFSAIEGVYGRLHWFERIEGSTDYVRLLREVPEQLHVPDV